MPKTTDWAAIETAFRQPFSSDQVKQRKGRGNMMFDYVDARDVENRLDNVVGCDGWSDAYEVVDPARMGVKCTLTVKGVSKEGIGYPNNPLGSKGESDEPGKDAESDALKRAAVKFGIGRHLYEKDVPPERRDVDRRTGEIRPSENPQTDDARAKHLALMGTAIADLADARHTDAKTELRAAINSMGFTAKNTGDLSRAEIEAVRGWARTQLQLLQDGALEPAVEQEEIVI